METPDQPFINRRSAERFALAWTVVLPQGEARTRDISSAGLYLEVDESPAPGDLIGFILRSPDQHRSRDLWCEGRVVRVEQRETGVGLGVALERFRFGA